MPVIPENPPPASCPAVTGARKLNRRSALSLMLAGMASFAALALLPACSPRAGGADQDPRRKIVMLIAEQEYETGRTLPAFARTFLEEDFRVVVVTGSMEPGEHAFDNIEEIADADVLLISVRRRHPAPEQLDYVRRHIQEGKPVVGLRTSSHAFALQRNRTLQAGQAEWPEFDAQVIGGNYNGHHPKGPISTIEAVTASHPILAGVTVPFPSDSQLYRNTPLQTNAQALLIGTIDGHPAEPVAWTFRHIGGGRVFYTSLGNPGDFENPSFQRLLLNGIHWATGGE